MKLQELIAFTGIMDKLLNQLFNTIQVLQKANQLLIHTKIKACHLKSKKLLINLWEKITLIIISNRKWLPKLLQLEEAIYKGQF